ncbi:thiosulfate oxidation carrier complex protein SoxZ [Arcobacter porcinus]|uniref:Sulfur oxidation protein SoxYZ, sulfur compound chelating protein n=1 Tax=Arcobacter porcinus TaxID=1935204 RepID=A0A1C0AYR6_9BACT|nr:thiosulfate oxidation carrier complex protein SoxZ [Arcobacter porcinus]OCL94425.1 sulfur oxidation protein SoxZ [Aliarcobacter thereius]OCL83573.1 sulfur oxidation protein SoxZ [Arcobacter porcinus]OCL83792.1 sulfur oxidation protein SoxZ [Arcobacter porcinus]OCL87927.1 sulfur oxidation protein SoxZ [Arcobacter porcinus]OCL92785.1 sulfur oxidation protein SoxZ [Arcobacter porcinus]
MSGTTRIKAKVDKQGICEVKALAKHDMLSYQEAERAKKEANFITYLVAKVNGTIVYELSSSQFFSKDPFFKFSFTGAKKGDQIELTWTDLKGNSDTTIEAIK